MFLNEPILKVYDLQYRDECMKDWYNAYLHTTGAFEYHVTEGFWLLLETENHYVTIGFDGLQKYQKPHVFNEDKFEWWYNGDDDWIDYKDTLLFGQKIHSIENVGKYQVIFFDSFNLHLYVYGENEFNLSSGSFGDGINIMALGGHLLNKCECGGLGELLSDDRGDFAVRCKSCHRATYFDMILKYQIDAWNNGDTPCIIDTGRESALEILRSKKEIKYMIFPSHFHDFEIIDETSCYCSNIMIGFGDTHFLLSSQKISGEHYDFTGMHISDFNREIWCNTINPTNCFVYIGEEEDHQGDRTLRFKLDDIDLLIEATPCGLSVSLDEAQLHLNWDKIKRKSLFIE